MQRARTSASLLRNESSACERITNAELGIYPMDEDGSDAGRINSVRSDIPLAETRENSKRVPGRLFSWKRYRKPTESRAPAHIALPPLHTLVRVTTFLLDRESYGRYVEPHIDEIRFECYQALRCHKRWLARWVLIRGYWTITRPVRAGILKTIQMLLRGP
jgi:hypothetical protein